MKKKNTLYITCLLLILFSSCGGKYIITKSSIGNYALGKELNDTFDENNFDIKLDTDGLIKSIIVTNPQYKTVDGFGVGSNLQTIKKNFNESKDNDLMLSKGKRKIGRLGKILVYNDITFVDSNNDNIVDYLWIQKH